VIHSLAHYLFQLFFLNVRVVIGLRVRHEDLVVRNSSPKGIIVLVLPVGCFLFLLFPFGRWAFSIFEAFDLLKLNFRLWADQHIAVLSNYLPLWVSVSFWWLFRVIGANVLVGGFCSI
jgi:hypothetical protein